MTTDTGVGVLTHNCRHAANSYVYLEAIDNGQEYLRCIIREATLQCEDHRRTNKTQDTYRNPYIINLATGEAVEILLMAFAKSHC